MALRPLGYRVLVQPDEQPDQTDSGLILPQDRDHVPVSGAVVAIGDGSARDQRIRAAAIRACMDIVREFDQTFGHPPATQCALEELGRYLDAQAEIVPSVQVGDRVAFPVECGLTVNEDGVRYIILNMDDVVVEVTEQEEVAA